MMDFSIFSFARARRAHFATVWGIEDGRGRRVVENQKNSLKNMAD